MATRDDLAWFKTTFQAPIRAALAGTPFSLDLITAIAAQETGDVWGPLHSSMPLDQLLAICVGDTLDADKGRAAFPKTMADLIAVPNGQAMFDIAHQALVDMAAHVPAYAAVAKKPSKFCHAFGIFQFDLQFFKVDPDFFLQKRWHQFDASLGKCLQELHEAMQRIGLADRPTLSDLDQVHVAIAYNAGSFKPAKGLKQGFFDGTLFYGERIFDLLRLAQSITLDAAGTPAPALPPGVAPIASPTPIGTVGDLFEVSVKDAPLRLRREPAIDKKAPDANVIALLPDGQRVHRVAPDLVNGFAEVETTLLGGLFHGFAAAEFLVPVTPAASMVRAMPTATPAAMPEAIGIVEVFAPRRPGSITRRTAFADAHSLNEPNQPTRTGTTPAELRANLADIIDYLAVDKSSHKRYQPRAGATFCNIYAHDYCLLADVYLPRVWWTPDAMERLAKGLAVEPRLNSTIDEQRSNDLFRWLNAFGPRFGWRRAGSITELQTEVNVGGVGLIVSRRTADGLSGHIVMVVPETPKKQARRSRQGEVIAPLQSQAGRTNFRYGTGQANWWTREQFAESAFWLHA
jgi:hypothetical protein